MDVDFKLRDAPLNSPFTTSSVPVPMSVLRQVADAILAYVPKSSWMLRLKIEATVMVPVPEEQAFYISYGDKKWSVSDKPPSPPSTLAEPAPSTTN